MKKLTYKKIALLTVPFTIGTAVFVILLGSSCCSVKQIPRERLDVEIEKNAPVYITNERGERVPNPVLFNSPQWKWWKEMKKRDRDFEWKMPIAFYGRVVDFQDGSPIQDAKIELGWNHMSGSSKRTLYSDAEGKFILTGVRGKCLGVHLVSKEGYSFAWRDTQSSFEYAAFFDESFHQPDPQNPVIFKLRKAEEKTEGLLVRREGFKVDRNGIPFPITLRTADKGTPADITISITHGSKRDEYGKPDWNATIAGANGAGLIESNEEFMYEAPASGYKSQYSYSQKSGTENYRSEFTKKYYVRTGNGKYARIEVEFCRAYSDDATVFISFYINPKGSRNLASRPNMNLPKELSPARE